MDYKKLLNRKILFHCFIVILLLGFFILNVNIAYAGPCTDAGGTNCYTTCPSNMVEISAGSSGCGPSATPSTIGTKCCGAQGSGGGIIPDGGKKETGDYTLNDFAKVAINISDWILGIVGSLALLAFVAGGVLFLISAGSSEKVTQAKQIILGAVVGLVIVFTSYMIINFVAQALGIQETGGILKSTWFN